MRRLALSLVAILLLMTACSGGGRIDIEVYNEGVLGFYNAFITNNYDTRVRARCTVEGLGPDGQVLGMDEFTIELAATEIQQHRGKVPLSDFTSDFRGSCTRQGGTALAGPESKLP